MKEFLKKLCQAEKEISSDINIPNDFYQTLYEQLLGRDYLADTSDMKFLNQYVKVDGKIIKSKRSINWVQITRLPVHPNENEKYDLLSRWQGVLSSLHSWGYRLYFLLLRYEGKTKIYLGSSTEIQEISAEEAVEQVREAAVGSMPGIVLKTLKESENISENDVLNDIYMPLSNMKSIGAVTGIPSLKKSEQNDLLQTLDQLAFGVRDVNGNEKDYAMLVIADPMNDAEISDVISNHRKLSSDIHVAVKKTINLTSGKSRTYDSEARKKATINFFCTVVGTMIGSCIGFGVGKNNNPQNTMGGLWGTNIGSSIGGNIASIITSGMGENITENENLSIGTEYLDKFAEYAESATEQHIKRLNDGRNYGFWNTGIYVLGNRQIDVKTVTGMLRSVYSGEETYFEPIRLHLFNADSNAVDIVRNNFDLLPIIDPDIVKLDEKFKYDENIWHVFGKHYQYLSTPINTKELSLATSLPRRDVPGLRFVKTAVRFANNPAEVSGDKITIGNIVDTGIEQTTTYDVTVDSFVRHALVSGSTGSGKSTTCKKILNEVIERNIPVMVIEPAKDDYVRWAIEMNKSLPEEKKFRIYMPGVTEFEGTEIQELKINPFEPACSEGAQVDLLQHSETFATLLNACLPSEEVVPILIEETVYETIRSFAESRGIDFEGGTVEPLDMYPDIQKMIYKAAFIMGLKDYSKENKGNLKEVLETRFKSLSRGMRGKVLNVDKSVDYSQLFSGNVIINISRFSGSKDKALIMSLLMNALYEYRISLYSNDEKYRKQAQQNRLMHLALIEEAHNVLLKPDNNQGSGSPQRAAAELFGNMLSEVRGYGQGFIVVDQVPTRLIPDAIKNTNYKIIHRLTSPDDQDIMASSVALRDDQKYIIPALEKGNAIIYGDEDDAAAWVKISLK